VQVSMRSVSLCPPRLRRVIFEKANIVLSRFRAVSNSCASTVTGVSVVPAVREPSRRMSVFRLWAAMVVWSQRSRRVVMRVCMWLRLGDVLAWWLLFWCCVSWLCWWKSALISCLFSSVMWNGKGPMRR